ncbi:MAG: nucleoside phosphorylase [Bacteroidales bacterium]|nr:nucleoside phosphorylase [Bacteroidales bacterium]
MRIAESELIIKPEGSVFHLHLRPDELSRDIILVGDPSRVGMISSLFDSIECHKENREFFSTTGSYKGKRISVLSTGIGTDNVDIVMTELDALANIDFNTREEKADKTSLNILRIGTCGAVQPDIPLGGFIFSEISIGCDGLLGWYKDRDKVALKGYEEAFMAHCGWKDCLTRPYFVKAGEEMTARFRGTEAFMGMTISAPGFYGPQGRQVRLTPGIPSLPEKFETFSYEGHRITNIEMESSAIAGLSALLGHNAGTICCAIANRHHKEANPDYKSRVKEMALFALDRL